MRPRVIAIADDFTGAAETAAIGHRLGFSAAVLRAGLVDRGATDVTVHDTDSRLDPVDRAVAKIVRTSRSCIGHADRSLVFKKVDSVLRGHVLAEVIALAKALRKPRVLLVPANPSLGRKIENERYFVERIPLDQTAFARDPHHPARSANVRALLGSQADWPIHVARPADPLPAAGVIVGEVASAEDVHAWAQRLDATMLPAGGGDFFSALLAQQFAGAPSARLTPAVSQPTLVIAGSVSSAAEALEIDARRRGVPIVAVPVASLVDAAPSDAAFARWTETLEHALSACGCAIVHVRPVQLGTSAARRASSALAEIAQRLLARGVPRHLFVLGGATVGALLDCLAWDELELQHGWGSGVVSLQPAANPCVMLTVKPGSYPMPADFEKQLWRLVKRLTASV